MKLLFIKLSEMIRSIGQEGSGSYDEKLSMLRSQFGKMPYQDGSMEGLAPQLTRSESDFKHVYKGIFGISVRNDVIRSRMEHAKWDVTDAEEKAAHRETKNDVPEYSGLKAGRRSVARGKQKCGMTVREKKAVQRNQGGPGKRDAAGEGKAMMEAFRYDVRRLR